jgi:hypothetical protein
LQQLTELYGEEQIANSELHHPNAKESTVGTFFQRAIFRETQALNSEK